MTKSKHTVLTIIILIILSVGLVFTFSKLNFDNKLKADNNNSENPIIVPPFEHIGARNSTIDGVIFENNFGGSGTEEINKVLTLDYNYIIGTTNSKDKYFEANSHISNIFILKLTHSGSVINISLPPSISGDASYADSFVTGKGIYILSAQITSNSLTVYFYNFSDDVMTTVFTEKNANPLSIIKTNDLIINFVSENKIKSVLYDEETKTKRTVSLPVTTNQIILTAPFLNGQIILFNTYDTFYAYYISREEFKVLYMQQNYKLLEYTINSEGFVFLLNTLTYKKIVMVDYEFKTLSDFKLKDDLKHSQIKTINQNIYIVSITKESTLNIKILSKKGDSVFDINRPEFINKFLLVKDQEDNLQIAYLTQENNLKILTLSGLTNTINEVLLPFSQTVSINDIDKTYDNNFIIYGTATSTSTIIQKNFGNYDVFVLKLKKNY